MTKTDGIFIPGTDLDRIGRIAGWAPGSYTRKCLDCNEPMVADKRASQCFACAVITLRDAALPKPDPLIETVFKSAPGGRLICRECFAEEK